MLAVRLAAAVGARRGCGAVCGRGWAAAAAARPAAGERVPVVVDEDDIEESFQLGSGKGGQKINKTASCVVLKHRPSGIVIKCQDTRSLQDNRRIARKRLKDRLDLQLNGDASRLGAKGVRRRERKATQRRKALRRIRERKEQAAEDGDASAADDEAAKLEQEREQERLRQLAMFAPRKSQP